MNPDYRIFRWTYVTKNKVSLITGKDNDGNQTAEAMIASLNIALRVALFLLNTDRIQKAIEMCSECLILLSNTDQNSKDQFDSLLLQFYTHPNIYQWLIWYQRILRNYNVGSILFFFFFQYNRMRLFRLRDGRPCI